MHVDPSASHATVTGAIRQAARMTGADFQYLLATAQVESNFRPNAKAATSSARGLFQFIEQTWLQTLKEQGPALGYGAYADAIVRLPFGKYVVAEPRMRAAIMNLRSDPTASAVMAGAFTRANAARLTETLGRAPTEGELYIAHFLGATGASRLIGLSQSRPTTPAAAAFPGAAQANRAMFYDRDGRARGASEVYRVLVGRYQVARAGGASAVAANDVPAPPAAAAPLDRRALADTYALYAIATIAGTVTHATPVAASATTKAIEFRESGPVFHGLFRTAGADEPVAPVVSSLWTTPTNPPVGMGGTEPSAPASPPAAPLDLFQELPPDARPLFRGRV
jgi:hypothetical protein